MSSNTFWILFQFGAAGLMYSLGHREYIRGRKGWAYWFYFFMWWNTLGALVDLVSPPAP